MRKIEGKCENCLIHEASLVWINGSGYLALTREYLQQVWCKCCSLKAQIEHIEGLIDSLPTLQDELRSSTCQ